LPPRANYTKFAFIIALGKKTEKIGQIF
jgi:hypothetical protein